MSFSPFLVINPPVIAHRGASLYAPENTISAFKIAKKLGLQWVEFDVMLAKCGEAVVIHDEILTRTTNGKGHVNDYSYEYLKNLDAGSWFHPQFSFEKIPTLKEVIRFLIQEGLYANIEIKAQDDLAHKAVEKILEVIRKEKLNDYFPPLISSFSRTILKHIRADSNDWLLGFLMDEWQTDWDVFCKDYLCASVNVNETLLNADKVREIKASNRLLTAYVVNDIARANTLFALGVDAIFSDCPDLFNKINMNK